MKKRVGRIKRKYDFTGIPKTPFTVIVSLPEHDHTGNYRVHATEEIHRSHVSGMCIWKMCSSRNLRIVVFITSIIRVKIANKKKIKQFKNRNTWTNKFPIIKEMLSWNFSLLFPNEIQCFIQFKQTYICNIESSNIEIWLQTFHYVCKIAGEVPNFRLWTCIIEKFARMAYFSNLKS